LILSLAQSESARDSVILLPLYAGMTAAEAEAVVRRITNA
jgi:dTDP-4-amino-4,6-dideoxygalactose transaminase